MQIDADFLKQWSNKGHDYGTCMSHKDGDLMYVNIPKNASSWTKPNLLDWGWEFYNYHADQLNKTAIVVLRDPLERWISGIAEYFTLYMSHIPEHDYNIRELVFDRVCFDDHTEKQINFIHGLDSEQCIFLKCDQHYRENFSNLLAEHHMPNRYQTYDMQHVSENDPRRKRFKQIFAREVQNSKYLEQVKNYYAQDYELINQVKFYGTR